MTEAATPQAFAEWVAGLPLDADVSVPDLVARAKRALGRPPGRDERGPAAAAGFGPVFQSPSAPQPAHAAGSEPRGTQGRPPFQSPSGTHS